MNNNNTLFSVRRIKNDNIQSERSHWHSEKNKNSSAGCLLSHVNVSPLDGARRPIRLISSCCNSHFSAHRSALWDAGSSRGLLLLWGPEGCILSSGHHSRRLRAASWQVQWSSHSMTVVAKQVWGPIKSLHYISFAGLINLILKRSRNIPRRITFFGKTELAEERSCVYCTLISHIRN